MQGTPATPACANCRECVPLRTNYDKINLSASNRKLLRQSLKRFSFNILSVEEKENDLRDHFELYKQYLKIRHPESPNIKSSFEEFIEHTQLRSHLMEVRDCQDEGRLVAFQWVDIHGNAASYDYQAYNVELSKTYSLGKVAWLMLMELGHQNFNIQYFYGGHWVKNSPKLGYKSQLPGQETFIDGEWVDFDPETHTQGPNYITTLKKIQREGLEVRP